MQGFIKKTLFIAVLIVGAWTLTGTHTALAVTTIPCPPGMPTVVCLGLQVVPGAVDAGTQAAEFIMGDFFSIGTIFYVLSTIIFLFFKLAQVFLAFSLWWFDGAIYYTVILMGAYINNDAAYKSITLAWGIIRDLGNVLIIGGFVAVGIGTIIQASQYAADKLLVKLIIAALLINFSYFFAGAVIDATNYVTIQIYNSKLIQNNCDVKQTGVVQGFLSGGRALVVGSDTDGSNTGICSLAGSMMGYTRMTSWDEITGMAYDSVQVKKGDSSSIKGTTYDNLYFNLTILGLMGLIFSALMAWVLIQAAFMLIVRFVGLIFLLITSPIGIAGIGVPFINEYASKWWSALFSQALFAPVYIFFFGLSLTIVKNFNDVFAPNASGGQVRSYADAIAGAKDGAQGWFSAEIPLFISFFIAIASMFLAYMLAKRIADSTPELKMLYDGAANYANMTLRQPKNLMNLGSYGARYGIDKVAGATREGTWSRFGLTATSALFRGFERAGMGKKNEKGVWEEASTEIKEKGRGRVSEENRKRMEGTILRKGLLEKEIGKLSDSEKEEIRAYLASQKTDDLVAVHGWDKVRQWAAADLLVDSKKLKEINDSSALTTQQKKAINDAYFNKFKAAVDPNRKDKDGKVVGPDWQKAAEIWEDMDETEREILLAERKELRTQSEFLAQLKRKDFDSVTKGGTREEQAAAKKARADGLNKLLRSGDRKTVEDTVKRMSEDEIGGMDEDTALAVLRTGGLSASDKRTLRGRTLHQAVRDELDKNHSADLTGTGFSNTPPPPPPPPPPESPPQAASNQGSGLGGGNKADLTPGAEPPIIIREEPSGPLR